MITPAEKSHLLMGAEVFVYLSVAKNRFGSHHELQQDLEKAVRKAIERIYKDHGDDLQIVIRPAVEQGI